PDLKSEALEAPYKRRPDYLKGIVGYKPPVPLKCGGLFIGDPQLGGSFEKGSPLTRLIDQTIFYKSGFSTSRRLPLSARQAQCEALGTKNSGYPLIGRKI